MGVDCTGAAWGLGPARNGAGSERVGRPEVCPAAMGIAPAEDGCLDPLINSRVLATAISLSLWAGAAGGGEEYDGVGLDADTKGAANDVICDGCEA